MHYDDTIDESRNYLRLALASIGKYGLATNPLNYIIWYEYASGRNGALNTAIDHHLENSGTFSEVTLHQFYKQYVAGDTETVGSLIRETLKKVFSEIMGAIQTTKTHFCESENNLESINESLVPDLSEADVEKIVARIKSEIKNLESSSSSFKDQLLEATREIDELKVKMARYRTEALRDPLTRIDNRRCFDQKLKFAIGQFENGSASLCLIIADIDHFKKINDSHGHLVGDNVLRMVAATIKDSIKGKDTVARIGGEEFAILLPDTPVEGALKLAENIRRDFERMDLKKKNSGESLGQVTLSFGVTAYRPGETAHSFMDRADEALYGSKTMGRNRVSQR